MGFTALASDGKCLLAFLAARKPQRSRAVSSGLSIARQRERIPMVGEGVQFDDETWEAIVAVARRSGSSFQEFADEAFADLIKKHKQPVGLMASLKESVGKRKPHRGR